MPDTKLLGTYATPRLKLGSRVEGLLVGAHDRSILSDRWIVDGYKDGPIRWPVTRDPRNRVLRLIVFGDLRVALERESRAAVSHHFGASVSWVEAARRSLKVPRYNEGTRALRCRVAPSRLKIRGGPRPGEPRRRLTPIQRASIVALSDQGFSRAELAREFQVTAQWVSQIALASRDRVRPARIDFDPPTPKGPRP